ncbi:hypothetical protein ATSB10_22440 [Dyella thiooxydans]|uniref:Uncharacterized protein n=1 Tax=Dyella thiooxydans TaxID=445710 RepID=A0A160N2Q6_9GAMM|nr:hypothetical protein ATSB10_22440 [Dyella thiooxydans]
MAYDAPGIRCCRHRWPGLTAAWRMRRWRHRRGVELFQAIPLYGHSVGLP